MGSIAQQRFLIQREIVPGTPQVAAMRDYAALQGTPTFNDEGEPFRRRGSRGLSAYTPTMESATIAIEAPQCFNALTPVLAGVLGMPMTTQPDATVNPTVYQHVFTLLGRGERSPVTFTSQWGDSANALQMAYTAFQSLTIGVQRSALTLETSAIAREPNHTITLASTGVTVVPAKPIPSRAYDVYMDDTLAAWGTTKVLKCYDMSVSVGDTWGMDAPINSAIASFDSLLENEGVEYTGSAQLGFDAIAKAMIGTFKSGALKYTRTKATGPIISGALPYAIEIDYPILITSRGEVGTAPNSSTVILPFNYELQAEPAGDVLLRVKLTNTVATI